MHCAWLSRVAACPPPACLLTSCPRPSLPPSACAGEDALVNVSIENKPDGSIKGHIRIRAKTQGVALSLGDRITSKQKG